MKSFFKDLFEYTHQCNIHFIETILKNEERVSEKSCYLMSHIFNAQLFWNARIMGIIPEGAVWQTHANKDLMSINDKNYANSLSIIDNTDFDTLIDYTNTKGNAYTNSVRDILFHIINHSSHHRGQVASDLRLTGIEPPISDYIFYKRNGQG